MKVVLGDFPLKMEYLTLAVLWGRVLLASAHGWLGSSRDV